MTIEEAKKGKELLNKIECLDKAITNMKKNVSYISPTVIREFRDDFIEMFTQVRDKYTAELNGLCLDRK